MANGAIYLIARYDFL